MRRILPILEYLAIIALTLWLVASAFTVGP